MSFVDPQPIQPPATSFSSPTPQWTSFVDLQNDVKPWLEYPSAKTDQDVTLQAIVDASCWWIQDYLGRPIAPTEFYRRFDGWTGWQGAHIMLPYAPILQVISVTEFWGTSGVHVLAEQTPTQQFGSGPSTGNSDVFQVEPIVGRIIRTFPGLVQKPFFPGSRNVEIIWIAGYDPIPPTVKVAALELVQHWYRNTQERIRMADKVGPYGGDVTNDLWPAVPNRVVAFLEPFVQQGIG